MQLLKEFHRNAPELLRGLKSLPESYWSKRAEQHVLKMFHAMSARVPAYTHFLDTNGVRPGSVKTMQDIARLPIANKKNYLQYYDLKDLCWDGVLKDKQWTIASTSGSTGEPFYFPRTQFQDRQFALTAELCLLDYFEIDKKSTLFLDCFALGVWIGGMFMYQAIKYIIDGRKYRLSMITPGADKVEALKAIKRLAPQFDQVIIGGYGPLVKDLIDDARKDGFDWHQFDIKYFFAAEGFTEGFRDYVVKYGGVKDVHKGTVNHYGTADLGTMAHETPLSILLRRLALKHPTLREKFFSRGSRVPTFTQFIPELFYFEEVEGRLLCSGLGGCPLMRYDLKDVGQVTRFDDMVASCMEDGIDLFQLAREHKIIDQIWHLPFVGVYERNDFTVNIYSVNIYPESIKKALEKTELELSVTGKFTMLVDFDEEQNQYLQINVEMKQGIDASQSLGQQVLQSINNKLYEENSEWRDFYDKDGIREKIIPRIVLCNYQDQTYFKAGRKQQWVKRT